MFSIQNVWKHSNKMSMAQFGSGWSRTAVITVWTPGVAAGYTSTWRVYVRRARPRQPQLRHVVPRGSCSRGIPFPYVSHWDLPTDHCRSDLSHMFTRLYDTVEILSISATEIRQRPVKHTAKCVMYIIAEQIFKNMQNYLIQVKLPN